MQMVTNKQTRARSKTSICTLNFLAKNKTASKYERLQFQWVTRSFGNDGNYFATNNKGKFDTYPLKIDLSAYEGQVVDVIVAAKPYRMGNREEKNDIYLPIAKIDNVGVYGKNGTFFTRLHRVILDQCITTDDNVTTAGEKYVAPTANHLDASNLNFADKWDLWLITFKTILLIIEHTLAQQSNFLQIIQSMFEMRSNYEWKKIVPEQWRLMLRQIHQTKPNKEPTKERTIIGFLPQRSLK